MTLLESFTTKIFKFFKFRWHYNFWQEQLSLIKKVKEKAKLFHTVHYNDENYERKVNIA